MMFNLQDNVLIVHNFVYPVNKLKISYQKKWLMINSMKNTILVLMSQISKTIIINSVLIMNKIS
jgi:expansin (peptidoglycan-binding protein)